MWQRIQTLYIILSTILSVVMLCSDLAVLYGPDGEIAGDFTYAGHLPLLILLIVILLLNLLTLFTYKQLIFQMRTAGLSALITLGLQIWVASMYFTAEESGWVFRLPAVFPAICIILDILAARAIMGDVMIIESASSLRKSRRERRGK
ncbi:MAG: DUF4293 family protein [Bacteroidales bacterium]|nr:DUF4293 family protein [Bacteroidales bacterium]MBR0240799.1 DUF4293 family protein [Bacteroidales bacterium]MBR0298202.1 DUF4293 family protein [Bacteroidales bacterium]